MLQVMYLFIIQKAAPVGQGCLPDIFSVLYSLLSDQAFLSPESKATFQDVLRRDFGK